ncbi:hypothetical protein Tco_0004329 [Tanacetum coccineum]
MIVAHTITQSEENNLTSIETTGVKEVEMVDAESTQGSVKQGIKEVEMKDAEIVLNETCIEENITKDERPVDVRDAKAKLEVDVKVKKMDQGDSKENSKVDNYTQTAARVVGNTMSSLSLVVSGSKWGVNLLGGRLRASVPLNAQTLMMRTTLGSTIIFIASLHRLLLFTLKVDCIVSVCAGSFSWGLVGGEGACPKVSERSLNNEYDQSNGNAYHVQIFNVTVNTVRYHSDVLEV